MASNVIAVVDFNSTINQKIETLLIASILEKRCKKLLVLDLNPIQNNFKLIPLKQFVKKGEFLTTKVFDSSTITLFHEEAVNAQKMLNFATDQVNKNDKIVIRTSQMQYSLNSKFYELADQIVVFADLKKDAAKAVVSFCIQHNIKNKNFIIYLYNYEDNIQCNKVYLDLVKIFRNQKVAINKLESIPKFKSLTDIENIDPWTDIYKKINGAF